MPNKVRRKLIDVSKEEKHPELQASRVIQELDNLRNDALAQHEKREWSKLQNFDQVSSHLRFLRKCIQECGQKYKKADGIGADELISIACEYEAGVNKFVYNYREILSSRETQVWKEKLKDTTIFAINALGYMPHGEEGTPEEGYPLLDDYSEDYDEEEFERATIEDARAADSILSNVKDSDSSCQESPTYGERERNDDALEISEAVLIANLPSVPQEEVTNPIDLEIETRLEKIRTFCQTLHHEVSPVTDTLVESTPVETTSGIPNRNMVGGRDLTSEAVNSNPDDIENFNSWYNDKIF